MYAEGSYGNQGDIATLTSPTFTTTTGQSLSFYYHIYAEQIHVVTEGLAVIAKYNTSQNNELWWRNASTGLNWTPACIDLVPNRTLQLMFVAKRKGQDNVGVYDADVSVDDVMLRNKTCAGKFHFDIDSFKVDGYNFLCNPHFVQNRICLSVCLIVAHY